MIHDLLKKGLKWLPIKESERDFFCDIYSRDICCLRMNNFPEEPLWTLFYKDESIDFDDAPARWDIVYRRDISKTKATD